jgi:hypothetical protein
VTAVLVLRNLRTRQTRVLAENVASQFGLAATPRWIVFARSRSGQPVLVLQRGQRRRALSTTLSAPIAARGDRIAWAEKAAGRQRVVVFDVARGRRWIAADLPSCEGSRCYRIDAVTLADRGVVFDRGAVGLQPSLVVRRAFSARRTESVAIPHDPQPNLVPSSAGALYYVLRRGWYRWSFGQARPQRLGLAASTQPLRDDHGRWAFVLHPGCDAAVATGTDAGPGPVLVSPDRVRGAAAAGRGLCVNLTGAAWAGDSLVTTWQVVPRGSHSGEPTSVVLVSRAR